MYFSRFGKKGVSYKLLLLLERLTFLTADVVITTNETHKKVAIERGKFPKEKIFIVRSGPDYNLFEKFIANKKPTHKSKQIVSYLGIINPQDGVETLIKIAEYIIYTLNKRNVEFVIMGSGDAEQDLRNMVSQLNLKNYVKFTGWVEQDVMLEQLLNTDVV
jgi:glycosyltransferase involved in cell wall biosynthesis